MFNRYAYCRNNPLIYIDPTGLFMAETTAGDDDGQYSEGSSNGGDFPDTTGIDGPTPMIVIGSDGVTIFGPDSKSIVHLKYDRVNWPSLNAFLMGARPQGFFICDRRVDGPLGYLGFNHAYGFSYKTDPNSWGMAGSNGIGRHKKEQGPAENYNNCGCLKGSVGKEKYLMAVLKITADDGQWIGFVHDCHNAVERVIESQGLVYPGSPNGRWGGN
jgi:hypothetical protein